MTARASPNWAVLAIVTGLFGYLSSQVYESLVEAGLVYTANGILIGGLLGVAYVLFRDIKEITCS